MPVEQTLEHMIPNPLDQYLQDIGQYSLLKSQEEKELIERIHTGDPTAMEAFICSNLRLVVSVAKKYFWSGVDPLDLIQDLNERLSGIIQRYDPSVSKFSTYATYRLQGAAQKIVAKHLNERRLSTSLFALEGREDEEGEELVNLIEDLTAQKPDESTIEQDSLAQIRSLMEKAGLTASERISFILKHAGGWELGEIGDRLGVSYQAIQQQLQKAQRKLRAPDLLQENTLRP